MIDQHQIADNAHLVAVRGRIVDVTVATRRGLAGSAMSTIEVPRSLLVRDVPDIGVVAGDGDLAGAGQIEMAQAPHIAGERAVRPVDFVHCYLSIVAPEAFTIAVHFGISAAI